MSAQRDNRSLAESGTRGERNESRGQRTALARRSAIPNVPALLLDPFGFFDDNFSLFRGLQDMSRIFGQGQSGMSRSGARGNDFSMMPWAPATEVDYRDGNLVVSAELPGLGESDVDVQVVNGNLIIRGERRDEREQDEGGARRTEIRYGQFYRSIPLPDEAQLDHARAEFDNGILRVIIPVPNNVRQIPVQATSSTEAGASQKGTGASSTTASQAGSSRTASQQSSSSSSQATGTEKAA